ncbi:DUF1775 domain-containing protein [Streptomyces sp. NPDC001312]|uniref:DUF1775 domain-containing protein n=1 Tax=Streptomyces sp. NPDC001312 TaxID=3364561 RepID=UPI0036752CF3
MSIVFIPGRPLARATCRIAVASATALAAAVALAGPAAAHAEVEADTPQALATDVTLTFVSEAESASAGFTKVRVVLPEGIAPADLALVDAPKGWKLTATNDGYVVGGPALKTGVDAEHKIKVGQLPNAKELVFKTVETYSDGKVSRWIELPAGGREAEQPAPVLKLKAAAPGAASLTPSPSGSEAPSTSPAATASPSAAAATSADAVSELSSGKEGTSTGVIVGGAAALLVLGGGVWWLVKRRSTEAEG